MTLKAINEESSLLLSHNKDDDDNNNSNRNKRQRRAGHDALPRHSQILHHHSVRKHLHEGARHKSCRMLIGVIFTLIWYFYVAAAFQLSHAFKDSPTLEGLLYFTCCYLSVFAIWMDKLGYDARFVADDDIYHRVMEVIHLCLLGTMVVNVQPAETMRTTFANPNMLSYATALSCSSAWILYLWYDVKQNVVGGPEATWEGRLNFKRKFISFLCNVAAALVAGSNYCMTSTEQREAMDKRANHWPAYLILAGFVGDTIVYPIIFHFVVFPSLKKSHQEFHVPMNLEYTLHRLGEWVMLMLGESVLSILSLDYSKASQGDYNVVAYGVSFYAGFVTVTLFQYLFFRTQPTEGKDHALRRSVSGAFIFMYSNIIYSASLILMGCSYKMILLSFINAEEDDNTPLHDADEKENEETPSQERIIEVFCWSMTISFISLDFMIAAHRGLTANCSRLCPNGRIAWIPLGCTILLIGSWIFTLSVTQWVWSLEMLSLLGLLVVSVQVTVRTVGLRYFPVTVEAMERAIRGDYDNSEEIPLRWPNVTEPRVHGDDE